MYQTVIANGTVITAAAKFEADVGINGERIAAVGLDLQGEKQIDAVTAVSGSGPAYFFLLIEAMTDAGVSVGLSRQIAERLTLQTAFGAAVLQRSCGTAPSVLRRNVTSKGGTTEAALRVFKQKGFDTLVKSAIKAATRRAKELSR